MDYEVIRFIEIMMKKCRMQLKAGDKSLAEVKIWRGIYQEDAHSLLLFVIAMMPLNPVIRKCIRGYKLTKLQENINHLMQMDEIKLFLENRNVIGNPKRGSENKQSGYRDGFRHSKIRLANNNKWETTHDGKNRTIKSRKNQNVQRKGNLRVLGILKAVTFKQMEGKENFKKRVSQENNGWLVGW